MSNINKDILNCRILIVEDDYLGRVVLKEIFKRQGFVCVEEAENGRDGLALIQKWRPELVILDVIMPEMDGVECCKLIRADADPQIANVPILVQTALDLISDKERLFEAGASDYITKPIDPHEITARAVVHLEREVMTRRLREFNERLVQELEIAHVTQQLLIPDAKTITETQKNYDLHICGHYQPCSELGGDFWGFRSLSKDDLAIYIGDFSGHGVNAALNVFRLHALMQAAIDTAHLPAAHLSHLNAILTPMLPVGQFATMFYGIINSKKNTLSYASAGSPPPLLLSKNSHDFKSLDASETLLGVLKETAYQTTEVEFLAGDLLFLYSDALTETPDENGNMQPIEHWAELLQSRPKSGCGAFNTLLMYFNHHCAANLADDLTLNAYFRRE